MALRSGRQALLACVCAISLACGDDHAGQASSEGGVASQAAAAGYCDEAARWSARCGDAGGDFEEDGECRKVKWSLIEPRWTEAVSSCFDRLECDGRDDDCTAAGFQALGVDEAKLQEDELFQSCMEKAGSCGFTDDRCYSLAILVPTGRTRAMSCFDNSCSGFDQCLSDLLGL